MKKILFSSLALLLLVWACKKDDNLYDYTRLGVGAYLTLTKLNNTTIKFDDQANSKVSMQVGSKGSAIDKVNVHVVEGADLDKKKWKLVKSLPFTEGMTLEVTAAEIKNALGVNIKPGAIYTLYNEVVTKDGRSFSSANMDPDFEAQAAYNMAMSWTVNTTCPFDQTVFNGSFTVVKDTWQDYNPGDQVQVKPGPGANQITITVYPSPAFGTNRKGVVLDVNPSTSAVTIAEQVVGDYGADKNVSMRGKGSVNACQKLITLTDLEFLQGGADYGGGKYQLTLRQN